MKLFTSQSPVQVAFIFILIGSLIFFGGVFAATDVSNISMAVGNESVDFVNVPETMTIVPEIVVRDVAPEPTIFAPVTEFTTTAPVETMEPIIQETSEPTVTETTTEVVTITPEGVTEPAVTMTEMPTTEPAEAQTKEPAVTETVTAVPTVNDTITIPATVSPNTTLTSSDSIVTGSSAPKAFTSNQVIVRYNYKKISNKGLLSAASVKTNAEIGAVVQEEFGNEGLLGMQVVRIPDNMSVEEAVARYEDDPDVLYAEPNYIVTIASTPSDSDYSYQWGLHNTGQEIGGTTGTIDADIDAPEAWDLSTGSATVVVAVVDTGVDYDHPDLAANIWTNTGEIAGNGIDDDGNGYPDDVHGWDFESNTSDPMDVNSYESTYHGTHCAGIIGAVGNNGIGVTGVNWNVKIMPLRFLNETGSGTIANATKAILYAKANGADVISNSWGGYSYSQSLKDAIDSSSAVVVCAAGNDGLDIDDYPFYPASLTSANIISVAATDNRDTLADFSNYGATSVDLTAPGVYIYSTKKSSSYQYLSGTSMATPFVAGVAALVKAADPSLTATQVKTIILNNVDVNSSLSGKVLKGGRLNAYKSVASIARTQIGVYRSSQWILDYGIDGTVDRRVSFGTATDVPVVGDFNNDGTMDIGVYRSGQWILDYGIGGTVDRRVSFGTATDVPVVGDFNNDGTMDIGVYRSSQWILDYGIGGTVDRRVSFGTATDVPVVGDFNNDGTMDIGVYRSGQWILDYGIGGTVDRRLSFGIATDTPIVLSKPD